MELPRILTVQGFRPIDLFNPGQPILTSDDVDNSVHRNFVMDMVKRKFNKWYHVEYNDGHYTDYHEGEYILNGDEMVLIDDLYRSHDFKHINVAPMGYSDAAIIEVREEFKDVSTRHLSDTMNGVFLSCAHGTDPNVIITTDGYEIAFTELNKLGIDMDGIPNGNEVKLIWTDTGMPVIWESLYPRYYPDEYYCGYNFPVQYIINDYNGIRRFLGGVIDAHRDYSDETEVVLRINNYSAICRVQNLLRSIGVYSDIKLTSVDDNEYKLTNIRLTDFYDCYYNDFSPILYRYNVTGIIDRIQKSQIFEMLCAIGIDGRYRKEFKIDRIILHEEEVDGYDLKIGTHPVLYYGDDMLPRRSI